MSNKTNFRYDDKVKVIHGFYQGLTGILTNYEENSDTFLIELWRNNIPDENTDSNIEDPEEFVCKAIIKGEDLEKIK